eukprot:5654028-Lingulodinium_polyedra.AAC.1
MIEKRLLRGRYEAACDVLSRGSPEAQKFIKACPKDCEESDVDATATFLAEDLMVRLTKKIAFSEAESKQS